MDASKLNFIEVRKNKIYRVKVATNRDGTLFVLAQTKEIDIKIKSISKADFNLFLRELRDGLVNIEIKAPIES